MIHAMPVPTATSVLSGLGYAGLRLAGIPALARRLTPGGVVLAYHNVVRHRDTPSAGDPGAHQRLDRFVEQMRWVRTRYAVVPLNELVARLRSSKSLRGLLALTFDDGYRGTVASALPVLRALGLPATLFVVGAAPGRTAPFWWDGPTGSGGVPEPFPGTHLPASWEELRQAVRAGFEVGAHSMHHDDLTELAVDDLAKDLASCGDHLALHLGVRPTAFAYPYGRWNARVRDAVRTAGYDCAVTLDGGANNDRTDPWALRRQNIPAGIRPAAFECWTAGIRPPGANR
jgi:peptidoglycan/xylan/chitin deacetylase (PgdA/CDA1 family)